MTDPKLDAQEAVEELHESDIFILLSKRRRRLALRILQESVPPLSTRELAERIGECEQGNPSEDDLEAIHLALVHDHLPRLQEADVVSPSQSGETVSPGRNFGVLVRVLVSVNEADLPWSDE